MKKILFIALLLGFYATSVNAQSKGNPQLGVRAGLPFGATVRYFFDDANAVEGIAGAYAQTYTVTGLYEHHFDLSAMTTHGFAWFIGGGAHVGSRTEKGSTKFIGGVDGIAGVDYTFEKIPLNMSIDWKPAVHFNAANDLTDFAISIRYTFGK